MFHLILGLKDDGFGHELGADQGREDTPGDDHEKKTEHKFGTQGKTAQEGNIRKDPKGIHVILSDILGGKFESIINNKRGISQREGDGGTVRKPEGETRRQSEARKKYSSPAPRQYGIALEKHLTFGEKVIIDSKRDR